MNRSDQFRSSGKSALRLVLIEKNILMLRISNNFSNILSFSTVSQLKKKNQLKLFCLRAKGKLFPFQSHYHYKSSKRIEGAGSTFSNCKTITTNDNSRNYKGRRNPPAPPFERSSVLTPRHLECSSLERNLFFVHLYREPLDRSFFLSFFLFSLSPLLLDK